MDEVFVSYGQEASKDWLRAGFFEKVTAGKMDDPDLDAVDGTEGPKTSTEYLKVSKSATVHDKLHEEISVSRVQSSIESSWKLNSGVTKIPTA